MIFLRLHFCFYFPFLICLIHSGNAQECGTPNLEKERVFTLEKIASSFQQTQTTAITYLPVKIHATRTNLAGTSNDTYYYNRSFITYEFQKLNEAFAGSGIQFFLCDSINFIENTELDYFTSPYSTGDSIQLKINNVDNAINVYYVNGSNVAGRSNFPNGDKFYNWMFVKNASWDSGLTLIHEMGHYFNLYHTFETFFGSELVNGSNCGAAGDFVCDTPADRIVSGASYNTLNCTYTGTVNDANGHPYTPLINNYMSYYGSCEENFTPGQFSRAQAGHAARLSLIQAAGNQYNFNYTSTNASVPYNLRVFEINGQLRVVWDDSLNYKQLGYIVERSTHPTTGFKCIASTSKFLPFLDETYIANTTYYYRVKSIHAKDTYSNIALITTTSSSYSQPECLSSGDNSIQRFRFKKAGLPDLSSFFFGERSEPYENFTNISREIKAGTNYLFTWESLQTNENDSFKVWIDYNRNQIFENSEMLVKGTGTSATDSVQIPSTIGTNFYTMRFRVWEREQSISNSTQRTRYTETKDYMLYIKGTCSGNQEFTGSMYRISGNRIKTKDVVIGIGYPSDVFGPGYEGYITGKQSVELLPGFQLDPFYFNFNIEVRDCE